jgi:hypothetical protein
MNKYQETLKRLEGMVLTSPFKNDVGDGVVDMNDLYKCGTQLQNEYLNNLNVLKELVDKAESFEWIPVSKKLPDEHDSIFAKLYGTDKWDSRLHRTVSNRVLAAIKYDDGTRIVKESCTYDGKWRDEKRIINCKVVAWMPMPEPYKENENE